MYRVCVFVKTVQSRQLLTVVMLILIVTKYVNPMDKPIILRKLRIVKFRISAVGLDVVLLVDTEVNIDDVQ